MIAVSMKFLGGRFHATPWGVATTEGVAEWPPSSWRLLRALAAAYFNARPAGVDEDALRRVVEALAEPPRFELPPTTRMSTVHYDAANGGVKFLDNSVVFGEDNAIVWCWPEAELDARDRATLVSLLGHLSYFGRAESWCEARLLDDYDASRARCAPVPEGEAAAIAAFGGDYGGMASVLVPHAGAEGLFESILEGTASMQKAKRRKPRAARTVVYLLPSERFVRPSAPRAAGVTGPTRVRLAIESKVRPPVEETLTVAETLRFLLPKMESRDRALMGWASEHKPAAQAFILPTDEDGDGQLDHVTVACDAGLSDEEVSALHSLQDPVKRDNPWSHNFLTPPYELHYDLRFVVTDAWSGGAREPTREPGHPLGRSDIWVSSTPFVLPRPADRGGDGVAQLEKALADRGFPEPVSIEPLDGRALDGRPEVPWFRFRMWRKSGPKRVRFRREGCGFGGFRVTFPEAVEGPIAVGFGAHFGLGLFVPMGRDK